MLQGVVLAPGGGRVNACAHCPDPATVQVRNGSPADVTSGLAPHVAGRPPAMVRLPQGECDVCGIEAHVSKCHRHDDRHECTDCAQVCAASGTWALNTWGGLVL